MRPPSSTKRLKLDVVTLISRRHTPRPLRTQPTLNLHPHLQRPTNPHRPRHIPTQPLHLSQQILGQPHRECERHTPHDTNRYQEVLAARHHKSLGGRLKWENSSALLPRTPRVMSRAMRCDVKRHCSEHTADCAYLQRFCVRTSKSGSRHGSGSRTHTMLPPLLRKAQTPVFKPTTVLSGCS